MAVRPIVTWPDPALREPAQPIESFDDDLRRLYRDLADTMFAQSGVGIAAIQIGEPRQIFLVEASVAAGGEGEEAGGGASEPAESGDPWAFINPEIVWASEEKERADEGCLSFPGVFVPIERPTEARIRAQNLEGEYFELAGDGLLARAFQHENDHLTGKLLVDFVGPLKKQMIRRKLRRDAA